MRSDHAPPTTATEVSLLFELGDKRYLVRRQPEQSRPKLRGEGETNEPHKAWLFDVSNVDVDAVTPEQGGTVLAETKVGAVNDRIGDLLNYGVEQFRQIVLLPQGKFLLDMGILERAGHLGASASEAVRERLSGEVERLAASDQMGTLFKVMAILPAGTKVPPFSASVPF